MFGARMFGKKMLEYLGLKASHNDVPTLIYLQSANQLHTAGLVICHMPPFKLHLFRSNCDFQGTEKSTKKASKIIKTSEFQGFIPRKIRLSVTSWVFWTLPRKKGKKKHVEFVVVPGIGDRWRCSPNVAPCLGHPTVPAAGQVSSKSRR